MKRADDSRGISVLERLFYVVIVAQAAFVMALGYFAPDAMQGAFSWFKLPPLHARFVGTLYLAGGAYVFMAMTSRHSRTIRPALGTIAVFTGVMFLVTLRNLSAFDFSRGPVWVWFFAYLTQPLIAIALIIARRHHSTFDAAAHGSPPWVRRLLWAHAITLGLLGAAMFLLPDVMASLWPWPVTATLVEAYGSPFLALAFCAAASADRRTWPEVTPALLALLALYLGTLIVSSIHGALFSPTAAGTWVWFGMSALGLVTVAAALIATIQRKEQQPHPLATDSLRTAGLIGGGD